MKFTTLIPTSRNDGQAVSRQEMDEIVQMFWVFGGCSVDGPIQGHWIDEQTGIHYADRCYRIVVVCDKRPTERSPRRRYGDRPPAGPGGHVF